MLAAVALAVLGCSSEGERRHAVVTAVVDGDTIRVQLDDGREERVRLILIDAPELQGAECLAGEATRFVEARLPLASVVELERDVSDRDRFERLLRYVWIDGELLNEAIVEAGLAVVAEFPPDLSRRSQLRSAERRAMAAGAGIWGDACAGSG